MSAFAGLRLESLSICKTSRYPLLPDSLHVYHPWNHWMVVSEKDRRVRLTRSYHFDFGRTSHFGRSNRAVFRNRRSPYGQA